MYNYKVISTTRGLLGTCASLEDAQLLKLEVTKPYEVVRITPKAFESNIAALKQQLIDNEAVLLGDLIDVLPAKKEA